MSIDDPQLAARIRGADPEALELVVHTYLHQVLRAARGAGLDPQRAEEVTQDTFVTFIEKASQFEGRSHVRTWLFGILYKKIAEARRQRQRERQMDAIEDIVEQRFDTKGSWLRPPQPIEAKLYSGEVSVLLEGCLEAVPTQQRMAFVLREVEGFTTNEICKILSVTRTNLGVLMYRVRNRLRECLEAKGVKG
ncbi:sigma-70 family RNA polymerase sigma factor [Acidobacteria bacterium AH-259-A15]|nr:sigma-70 family RNA polymerase sigma factor [Acidobacteria bacterium AH-259-A15]